MKKKICSILLMMAMIISMFPASAFAVTVDNSYIPGTYIGEAQGLKGKVNVSVTLAERDGNVVISDITATSEKETEEYWNNALGILQTIKSKNGTDGVDTVSSATYSSKGILDATKNALAKASQALSGNGTENDPYVIMNAGQLAAFAVAVDGGNTYEGNYVALGANIDLSTVANWNPIGNESGAGNIFNGTFDGKGHTVSNLTINANVTSGESNHGLFSTLGNKAVVKNLNVTAANIAVENSGDKVRAGILAGGTEKVTPASHSNIGTRIDSCSAIGSVSAVSTNDKLTYAGGIAGTGEIGTAITNCWTDATVSAVARPVSNKNSMAGGIIGNSGNYVLIANCATFGNVYAASPSSTNFGGMAGGIVGMMAGKQYNVYATGDMTIGNGGITQHSWVGALDGEVTSSGMTKDDAGNYTSYPAQGEFRLGGYYASDAVLKVEVYKNNGANLDTTTTLETTADRGSSSKLSTIDKAMVSTPKTKADMVDAAFAETLNGNIKKINELLAAYGIDGVSLREWELSEGRVLPTGNVWVNGEINTSIFASGTGTAEDPYLINTEAQLRAFAGSLNDKIDYTDQHVALGGDITLSQAAWEPVGRSSYLFNGTFDGKGHTVSGMTLGSKDQAFALDKENLYIGFFGVLGPKAVVKDLKLTNVAVHTTFEATAYVGGIAGVMQGSTTKNNYTGAVIDGCSVEGTLSLTGSKGNQFVGGIVGMQYKGAIINSSAKVDASGIVLAGHLAEVGGLVGLNNRGLVANSWSDSTIYGSGSRENGNEGMAVVSNLVACNAGMLVNCYGAGNVTTKEHSTYAGMVSGWVTGIGKSYNCWYNLGSTMVVGKDTNHPLTVNPVESIGTKVSSGVNDEGDAYTGGLVDKMTGYNAKSYEALAGKLNETFTAFPADITVYGLTNTALKNWAYTDGTVTFGTDNPAVAYVQPDCEKVEKPQLKLNDGTWYGRDKDKKSVVKITIANGAITKTEVISGEASGESYTAAAVKAEYKAIYGDFSHYEAADASKFAGGSGTAADPYKIANEAQLRYLAYSINADVDWSDKYFLQTADITLTGGDWQPIGWALNGEVNGKKQAICAYPFRGNYDGGDHTIRGLVIGSAAKPADQMTSGLFGLTSGTLNRNEKVMENDKVIHLSNIHLENIDINAATRYETFTGGLVGSGQNGIFIDNCSVTGKIHVTTSESFARAGGLAASVMRGAVTNSWADVDINAATDTNNVYAGGLYGMDNRVTTINCYALGDVTGNSTNNNKVHIGGFAGQAGGIHINCYAAGDVVSLKSTTDVGILNGRSAGIAIEYNCYYNKEAVLKQGDTVISPAIANGVVTTNATEINVEGRTKTEMSGSEFAALLNSNITDSSLKEAFAAVDRALDRPDLIQKNYYEGNKLSSWPVKNQTGSSGGGAVTPVPSDKDKTTSKPDKEAGSTVATKTTVSNTTTETTKNEQGQNVFKTKASVSKDLGDKLLDQALSNKSDTIEITVKSNDANKNGSGAGTGAADSVKATEVELPKATVNAIAKDTNADLVIKTDNGEVVLDNKTLETIAGAAKGDTVTIVVGENTQLKETQKPAEKIVGKNGTLFDLAAKIGERLLHQFEGGKAHVTLPMPEKLKGKEVLVIYIDDNGLCKILNHSVAKIGAEDYIRFTTTHFSTFAVVDKDKAERTIKEQNAAHVKELMRSAKFKVTTTKTSKKSVKVQVAAKSSKTMISDIKSLGCTVKYQFYRSTKKTAGYKVIKTKAANTFTNTKGTKGTKYYYKARVLVYDGKTLVAKSALRQCGWGSRTWTK